MPADKHQVITKRQHLCFDGLDQSRMIPARKIGSAHGPSEQDVADDRKTLVAVDEGNAAR
jgi:hypothetical protein